MRSKAGIQSDYYYNGTSTGTYAEVHLQHQNKLIIELLLDIRELLDLRTKQ